jgi:hypothetical protein
VGIYNEEGGKKNANEDVFDDKKGVLDCVAVTGTDRSYGKFDKKPVSWSSYLPCNEVTMRCEQASNRLVCVAKLNLT